MLGLQLNRIRDGSLGFRRGNDIPVVAENAMVTKRQLFSICGKLVGHYPVGGWLRVACSFLKRTCAGHTWEDQAGEQAQELLAHLLARVHMEDPVRGSWHIAEVQACRVWCDASNLALGTALEVHGMVVEDVAWLRKATDYAHINVAELEAMLKGINLALKWHMKVIEVMTDSATVHGWLRSTLTEDRPVKTHSTAEMLIKRQLAVFSELLAEFELLVTVTVMFARSEANRADVLTRVKRSWLDITRAVDCGTTCAVSVDVGASHAEHHRSLYLARLVDPETTRRDVEQCVRECV